MRKARPNDTRPTPVPDAGALHHAALNHLAKYAATEVGLTRVLRRRVDRWARTAAGDAEAVAAHVARARADIDAIVARLAQSGAISDAQFAVSRARSLAHAGRSRRAIGAHLSSRGVPAELTAEALPQDVADELAAALIHARRRRMGPWRTRAVADPVVQARRDLASFARAGFALQVARQALGMEVEGAEEVIRVFRETS